jgi:hypothetical protein
VTQADPLAWLLEPENPSARYLALTGVLDRAADDADVVAARAAIPGWGPARAILDAQWPEGYWMRPGTGYSPRHKATVWQVIFLAAMGAPCTTAVERACAYVLEHSRLSDGRFSAFKTGRGAFTCLNGNLLRAIFQLGYEDPRLQESLEALAEMVARDRFCCRNNAVGVEGGSPPARMRDGLPCAWGAIKALGAFAEVPEEQQSAAVRAAVEAGVAFLLNGSCSSRVTASLAAGDYPAATKPSPLWLEFGFPLGYTSDQLEALEVLQRVAPARAGRPGPAQEPVLAAAMAAVLSKRDPTGRWALQYTPDNTWARFGKIGQPNKWVTLRALRVLKDWNQRTKMHPVVYGSPRNASVQW